MIGKIVACLYLCRKILAPWNIILLEKLTVAELDKKFSAFYGT